MIPKTMKDNAMLTTDDATSSGVCVEHTGHTGHTG